MKRRAFLKMIGLTLLPAAVALPVPREIEPIDEYLDPDIFHETGIEILSEMDEQGNWVKAILTRDEWNGSSHVAEHNRILTEHDFRKVKWIDQEQDESRPYGYRSPHLTEAIQEKQRQDRIEDFIHGRRRR